MNKDGTAVQGHWDGLVRDNECDAGGVVYYGNYSVYLHEAVKALFCTLMPGVFEKLARHGLDLAVFEQNVRYLKPLKKGEAFNVTTRLLEATRGTMTFAQDVVEKSEGRLCTEARTTISLTKHGEFAWQMTKEIAEALRDVGLSVYFVSASHVYALQAMEN